MIDITIESLEKLLGKQDELNKLTAGENWRERKDINFYRAAWIECAELMDWIGWKWWKKQERNEDQILIEVVDILHFILSIALKKILLEKTSYKKSAKALTTIVEIFHDNYETNYIDKNEKQIIEDLVISLITSKSCDSFIKFLLLIEKLNLEWELVEKVYYGKNILNEFRQKNGYKEGRYYKTWLNGQEDNEVMIELLKSGTNLEDLEAKLIVLYWEVKKEKEEVFVMD